MRILQALFPSWSSSTANPYPFEKLYALNQIQRFESVLQRNDCSLKSFSSILEFGCGFGRLAQYMFQIVPQAQISGCDVLEDAVAECRRKFPQGHFVVNDPTPPLCFDDMQFDLIYSYSVFTHFSESNHAAWLKELARLLRPGGVMLHTTKSCEFLKRAAIFSPEVIEKYELPEPVDAFIQSSHPYHYVVDNPSMPEYGLSIISKNYVLTKWPHYSGLMVVDYVEEAIEAYPEGYHDIVMMVKESQ